MTTNASDGVDCGLSPLVQAGLNYSLVDMTEEQKGFTRGYLIFGLVLNIICFLAWIAERHRYERTRIRPSIFLVLAILCSIAVMVCGPLNSILPNAYPCWVAVVPIALTVPLGFVSVIGRYMLYNFLTRFAQAAVRFQIDIDDPVRGQGLSDGVQKDASSKRVQFCGAVAMIIFPNREPQSEQELWSLKLLSSHIGTALIAGIFSVPLFIASLIILANDPILISCNNCIYSSMIRYMIIVTFVICMVIGIGFWLLARQIKGEDKWGLKNECALCTVSYGISLIGFLGNVLLEKEQERNMSPITSNFLLCLGVWLTVVIQSPVQIFLARKQNKQISKLVPDDHLHVRNSKKMGNTITSSMKNDLDDILGNQEESLAFEQHLVGELGVESLYFLRQCSDWRKTYHDVSPATRLARARKINKVYVETSGLYAVNVSHSVNHAVSVELKNSEASDCSIQVFDEAIAEIRHMLQTGAVLRFRASKGHFNKAKIEGEDVVGLSTLENIT